jgi:agmatine deiminase
MAKKQNTKSIEETFWRSCDKLRGSVEPAEYKHVVLGLIFLKFASDKFEERQIGLIADLKIDGGNVIKGHNKVILTNKIIHENKKYTGSQIIKELSKLFNGSEVIIIPALPREMTGHVDGIVRIINDSTVFVSDFSKYKHYQKFNKELLDILNLHFTDVIPVPYFELDRKNKDGDYTATGCYINFLWIGNMVFLPEFGHDLDDKAISIFRDYFDNVIQVPSNGISEWGGVLNCVSWNI